MTKKKSIEETLSETRKVIVIPTKAADPTHFIKVLYNRFDDIIKQVPNSVLNDFIVITCRCAEFIEFDTNVIRKKSAVIAKRLDMTPQTLSTKLSNLERHNLIKRFKDPDTGSFSVVINTNYFYKCSEYRYITLQRQIFEQKTVDVDLIKEILDKIKDHKNFSIYKKKQFADREGKREMDQLEEQRKLELADKKQKIEYLKKLIEKLDNETEELLS